MRPLALIPLIALCLAAATPSAATGRSAVKIGPGSYLPLFPESGNDKLPPGAAPQGERPLPKTRRVEAFLMDRHPVTVAEYLEFLNEVPRWRRDSIPEVFSDGKYLADWKDELEPGLDPRSPVTRVSWFAAKAYCSWAGGKLPTVEQWEFAAAPESQRMKGARDEIARRVLEWYGQPTPDRLPKVGSTFANKYGAWDLHGLVWEWTRDFNSALVTGESRGDSSLERSMYCGSGSAGSSDFRDYAGFMRFAFRSSLQASYTARNLGFRCVYEIEKE